MERRHPGMVLITSKPIKMKNFLSICLLFLFALSSQAASPSFGSFNTNQFGTNGNIVSINKGAFLTNPVIRGAGSGSVGFIYSEAGRLQIQGAEVRLFGTNGGVTLLTSSLATNQAISLTTYGTSSGIYLMPNDGGVLGFRTNSTVGYVWTATNAGGAGDWQAPSGVGLTTNANQFGASTALTIKSGAVVTNLQGWDNSTFDNITLRSSANGGSYTPSLAITNGGQYLRLWQNVGADNQLDFSGNLSLNGNNLILNADFTFPSGAVNGYVLTTDNLGAGTWQVNPALGVSNRVNSFSVANSNLSYAIGTASTNYTDKRQYGSAILTNLAVTGAMTNGLIAGSNMTLTTNGANQVVFTASGGSASTNLTTLASGSATIGDLIVTNAGSFGSLTNAGTLTANSLGSNAVVSLIGKTASGQLVETANGVDPAFIRGLLVTKSGNAAIAVSAGSWYHNASNRVYSLPASTLSLTVSASTLYSVYASVSNSLPVLEAFAENPPATNYFGSARQRASGTLGRWIGHFITDSVSVIAPTGTKESGANSVSVMYQTPGTILNRILSAGAQTGLTVLTADAICPKYASTEMWSNFQYTYATTALAPLLVQISLDGTNVVALFGGYVSVANNFVSSSGWLPLSTNNTIYYKNTITSPGVAPSTYVDVYGVKYAR